jgi:hypothetical protein
MNLLKLSNVAGALIVTILLDYLFAIYQAS